MCRRTIHPDFFTGTRTGGKHSTLLGFKTLIQPSRNALHRHLIRTSQIIQSHQNDTQSNLIDELNPVIRGWTNYHSKMCAKHAFGLAQSSLFRQLMVWAKHRHPNKPIHWIVHKYWPGQYRKWDFTTPDGTSLLKHADVPIQRHTKVRGTKSPFDGDWPYWATRLGVFPNLPKTKTTLLKQQRGKCSACGLFFTSEDVLELDHILPLSQGGRNEYKNWQLLHRHCHDSKTRLDLSSLPGTHDQSQTIEEP